MDKLGHRFGPDALEMIDMIYHIDRQLSKFIKKVKRKVQVKDVLFVFTSDHGIEPIPELLQEAGIKSALRIDENELIRKLNSLVEKKYGISKLVAAFKAPQFFFNYDIFNKIEKKEQDAIVKDLKEFLKSSPGIKNAWTYNELKNKVFKQNDIERFYKNQLYPGRSGYITIQPFPFCQFSKYKDGTGHRTPYEHNTHVPLIIYQKGEFEPKVVKQRVSMLQFANTLSDILKVPKPPASTFDILPNLFENSV